MLIVGVALAPLSIASIIQAILNFNAYQRETDRILVQTALYAANNEQGIFTRAEQLLRSLSNKPELSATPQACWNTLSSALAGAAPIVNLTRVDAEGRIVCMGAVPPPGPGRSKLSWWPAARAAKAVVIGNQFFSPVLKRPLLPLVFPIRGANGSLKGAFSASVDLRGLETAPQISKLPQGTLSVMLGSDGRVLASNRPVPMATAAAILRLARLGRQRVFAARSPDGDRWRWVAEPIGPSDKFVAFGIPEPRLFATFRSYLLADVLLTLMIVVATGAAIWLGAEWLVVRWTMYLKRVAAAYGRNHFALSLDDLQTAPDEFRLLGSEMKRMAGAIQDRDRTLSEALNRQSAMTREIHHRIKNNLQIVSSLINIFALNVTSPMAKSAFRQIIARVDALTLIQRLIESNETDPTIDMHVLFDQFGEQIRSLALDHNQQLELNLDVEHRQLAPDVATPIVLFAIEALAVDIFIVRPDARRRVASISFSGDENGYLLTVEDGIPGALPIGVPNPERIMQSFAEQLRGRCWIERLENGGCRTCLRVPLDRSAPQDEALPQSAPNVYAFDVSRSRHA